MALNTQTYFNSSIVRLKVLVPQKLKAGYLQFQFKYCAIKRNRNKMTNLLKAYFNSRIVGAFIGGAIGTYVLGWGDVDSFWSPRSWLLAIGGSVLLLFIYSMLTKK